MKNLLLVFLIMPFTLVIGQNIISEEIQLKNGGIHLPGTLSYPDSEEKVPLVIFVHGSGNIDRNGNQAGTPVKADYIKILADSLNQEGIAFYRYDKRTATPSNLNKLESITLSDFVLDAKMAIDFFSNDGRFNSIVLIGHSQGSLVAMLSVTDAVDGFISLGGPSQSIDKVFIAQLSKQNKAFESVVRQHLEELATTDTIQKVNPFLTSIFAPKNQKFIADWMKYHPKKEIEKLTLPILIINGDVDLQVTVEDAENLHKANANSRLQIIPKMNHVLKIVNSMEENIRAYSDKSVPLSTELISTITDFIKKTN
ncbi:alpha/beta hydrolase [Costertonia aggregata]|uniref:Alpha/beta hydrolase n=1 Tax=Costertonia aggregata TaxID=343403 RepID=A0A7H9AL92_9FLAO|nr:alpha/beta hydrolase [Costertonia aggregata]QLG44219.1 alpha/beta hydrolase [Costertonia aggregata]